MEVLYSKKTKRNYIYEKGKTVAYAVYVAKNNPEICGEWFEGAQVHHLNRDTADDRPENLIVLNSYEHHKIHSNPVDVFLKGKYIGRYNSPKDVEEKLHIPQSTISYYKKHGKPISSTYQDWRFYVFH